MLDYHPSCEWIIWDEKESKFGKRILEKQSLFLNYEKEVNTLYSHCSDSHSDSDRHKLSVYALLWIDS